MKKRTKIAISLMLCYIVAYLIVGAMDSMIIKNDYEQKTYQSYKELGINE